MMVHPWYETWSMLVENNFRMSMFLLRHVHLGGTVIKELHKKPSHDNCRMCYLGNLKVSQAVSLLRGSVIQPTNDFFVLLQKSVDKTHTDWQVRLKPLPIQWHHEIGRWNQLIAQLTHWPLTDGINSLAIWCHRTWWTLVPIMDGCLMVQSHDLNQCWLVVYEVMWYSNLRVVSQEMIKVSITKTCLKITHFKLQPHLPGANELKAMASSCHKLHAGLILGLHPANERHRYKVTPSLIGWAQS